MNLPCLERDTPRNLSKHPGPSQITDLGVFTIGREGMTLIELAPDVSLDEIRQKTEASFAMRVGSG